MKTKFTKASKNDKTLVTVNLISLAEEFGLDLEHLKVGSKVFITIDGNEVTFEVNRLRKGAHGIERAVTATTHCFPRYLRLPQVGHPVFAEVTEVY